MARNPRNPITAAATEDPSDAALVLRARLDPDAFGLIYERYRGRVIRYCFYRTGNWSDAEDAVNDIFLKAFLSLSRFETTDDGFAPWLFRIAHNEIIDRFRRRSARSELPLEAAVGRAAVDPLPDEIAAESEAHDQVLDLLRRLPSEDQRRVCELRLAGLTGREIANVLGKRHDAVRQIQSRAMERLRQLIPVAGMKEALDA